MSEDRSSRQRILLFVLAAGLFFAGLVILIFLKRIPPFLRFALGMGDLIAGLTMLVLLKQRNE